MTIRPGIVGIAVILTACTASVEERPTPTPSEPARGGELLAAMVIEPPAGMDPQLENYNVTFELFRCCLLRTLLAYEGVEGPEGLVPRPDLATDLPSSTDDVEWTFRLRDDVRYAPPFDDVTVGAPDVIRAVERLLRVGGGVAADFLVIEGAADVLEGTADRMSGLSAPDRSTLVVRTVRPFAELPYLFAQPATAPIPPGADEGHDEDYGRYLVATGPYMIEGADGQPGIDPAERPAAAGFEPGRGLTLVRNPSWDPDTDPLRPAYLDRIEIAFGGSQAVLEREVQEGELDLILDVNAGPSTIERYDSAPELDGLLRVHPTEAVAFASLNVAVPPFDDVNVRRAVSLAIDREGVLRVSGGEAAGEPAYHLVPDSLVGGSHAQDPAFSASYDEALAAAREAMASSTYDSDGDGTCDEEACREILTLAPNDELSAARSVVVEDSLAALGIELDLRALEFGAMYERASSPPEQIAMTIGFAWVGAYPHPSMYLRPLLHSSGLADRYATNLGLTGATPEQLREWGYELTSVPSADDAIDACDGADLGCWGALDEDLGREVVAYVPLYWHNTVKTVSQRLTAYEFDQAYTAPALDRIAVG